MGYEVETGIPLPVKGMVIVHQCQRDNGETYSSVIVRKFKADCGNLLEVHVTRKSGYIKSIIPEYLCPPDCASCADRITKIRALIAAEHGKHG